MTSDACIPCSIENLRMISAGRMFVEGDSGWLFLTSDTNDQMAQQFGLQCWSDDETNYANSIIKERIAKLPLYKKFIVPEKSVVYKEYLPESLKKWPDNDQRPALRLSDAVYLLPCLQRSKPLGPLYFRGDTHPNWLGSYVLYSAIMQEMSITPLRLSDFSFSLAGFDGDLSGHMTTEEREEFYARVDRPPHTLDATCLLAVAAPKAVHIGDDGYSQFSRETLVYAQPDKDLPSAVIFRDSTCQFMTPWLAEHFSRSVFVWHRGDIMNEVIEREQPDIVFQVMAERFVWTYPNRAAII